MSAETALRSGGIQIETRITAMYAAERPEPLGARGTPSAIGKTALSGPWTVTRTGLAGDVQADAVNHGGLEKALHHYPREHYAAWSAEMPALASRLAEVPAFGENISTFGVTEDTVHVGDVWGAGEVLLQVSQGRQPCWKLNARFGVPDIAVRVQNLGRTGWYYRVLREGRIRPGDRLVLVERPQPHWPLSRVLALLYRRTLEFGELRALAEVPELAQGWRDLALRRVARREIESWTSRLSGEDLP